MNSSKFRIGDGGGLLPPNRIPSSWKLTFLLALSAFMLKGKDEVNDTYREFRRTFGDQEPGGGR
jgi:hypothetical protein